MEKHELMEKITGEKSPKFITERENLLLDGLLHLVNVKESLEKENERLKEALQGLYDFTLGKEGYLDSCLNDAEYALHLSTVTEVGSNE